MTLQTQLNRNITPNLKDNGLDRVNPHCHKEKGYNGFKMGLNKKGIIQFGIIAIAIAVIVVGFLAFNPFKAKAHATEKQVDDHLDDTTLTTTTTTEKRDNNVDTGSQEATPQNTTAEPILQQCVVKGEWQELWVKRKMGIDKSGINIQPMSKAKGIWKYTGTCTQDIYLEAGIAPEGRTSLAIEPSIGGAIPTTPSWCDNNLNYYGHLWKGARQGDLLRVDFRPKTPSQEGGYRMVVGAYTGCLSTKSTDKPISSGGAFIMDNTYDIKISDRLYREQPLNIVENQEALNSWERLK